MKKVVLRGELGGDESSELGKLQALSELTRPTGRQQQSLLTVSGDGQRRYGLIRRMAPLVCTAVVMAALSGPTWGAFVPWDDLIADSWICFDPADPKLTMHTVNGGDYSVGFDQAKSDNSARGMNGVKFSYGGSNTGHMVSYDMAGSFDVQNTGDRVYADVLVLVAIDAESLAGDFSLTLGGRVFDTEADFGLYDSSAFDAGRPSGYYSVTTPSAERLGYDLDRGMVSIMAFSGVYLDSTTPSVSIDYTFENLPSRAVFSAYALVEGKQWIYHTNRGLLDQNDLSRPVSTFEVFVQQPGDFNLDGIANLLDINDFVLALTDLLAYQAAYPDADIATIDPGQPSDGFINLLDINPFVAIVTGGGGATVPEPGCLVFLLSGTAALMHRRPRWPQRNTH